MALAALLLSPALWAAPDLQSLHQQIARKQQDGTLAFEADVRPALDQLPRSGTESQRLQLLRLLADIEGPPALRQSLRAALPASILAFARAPAHSPMSRDTALMLLRRIDPETTDLQAGIQLAEEEHAKGRPFFGNTARLLKLHLDRRSGRPAPEAQAAEASPRPQPAEASRKLDFDASMRAAQKAMSAGRHAEVLNWVLPLEAQLLRDDARFTEKEQWAWVLDFKRFALYELGRKPEALQTCRLAVDKLGGNDWPYLASFNVVRSTRRACHNLLAWEAQEAATSLVQLTPAIEHIDACFDTVSPIEDEEVLNAFVETRLRVYLKAASWAPQLHTEALHRALYDAEQRDLELPEDLPELVRWQKSEAYRKFRDQSPK